jgi:ligand-binding SRPBCC domain-containing protein
MPVITLTTFINAPIEKVFDLARSIDLHQRSMLHTNEKAIAGRVTGLIEEGETVTWEARHLFKTRSLTSKITSRKIPDHFRDEMINGDFKLLQHDHYFTATDSGTLMKDVFHFRAPYGIAGKLAEQVFLIRYLKKLLRKRNEELKKVAES